jgi:radical SAM protein with 4Fe4S-binding SPASM domain
MQTMQEILGFKESEIMLATKKNRLLSIEIEFSSRCNLRCIYCYNGKNLFRSHELELEEMFDAISQAKALGAKKIIYVGAGEPLLDTKLCDVINYVHKIGLQHILFTNATLIDPGMAKFFYKHYVTVIIKYSSKDPKVSDFLSGVPGSSESVDRGLDLLLQAGYPNKNHHLGIEAIICKQNINELPSLWRWARQNGIMPYFEFVTYQGSATQHTDLCPGKEEIRNLFCDLSKIDADEFNIYWKPHPPIAGFSCQRHLYSVLVNSRGFIQPCVGINLEIENIRNKKLQDILKESKVLQELRDIKDTIKGTCADCSDKKYCYGCRGTAYNMTGDYLASDPMCWRVKSEASACFSHSKK